MPQDSRGRWVLVPGRSELWIYTNSESYAAGDTVRVMASSTLAKEAKLMIFRDGPREELVHESAHFAVGYHPSPDEAYANGCGWPQAVTFEIPGGWPSGFYIVRGYAVGADAAAGIETGKPAMAEHFFIVRPALSQAADGRLLLMCSTNSWTSYNNWGGASHYDAHFAGDRPKVLVGERAYACRLEELFFGSPALSTLRPYSPGFVSLPPHTPRLSIAAGEAPREPAYTDEAGKYDPRRRPHLGGQQKTCGDWCLSSGWANYESYFYSWSVRSGYRVDLCSNRDLARFGLGLLDQYQAVLCVGHDEYWSAGMRDAVDAFLDRGGRVARFAGNFFWQVRFEPPEGPERVGGVPPRQICYKYGAANDPVLGTDRQHELTFEWESPLVGRPGCETFGLNGSQGLYCRMGQGANPSNPGGFTVYRPEHWAFEGTGLRYGDMLGGSGEGAVVFGFECDGLDYVLRDGLPRATGKDGANVAATRILAVGPCDNELFAHDHRLLAHCRYDRDSSNRTPGDGLSDSSLARAARGNGMVVEYRRGKGCVLHVGSTEWVVGLQPRHAADHHAEGPAKSAVVEGVTRNILDRFLRPGSLPELLQEDPDEPGPRTARL